MLFCVLFPLCSGSTIQAPFQAREVETCSLPSRCLQPAMLRRDPSSHLLGSNPLAPVCWASQHTRVPLVLYLQCGNMGWQGGAARCLQQEEGQVHEGAVSEPGWQ